MGFFSAKRESRHGCLGQAQQPSAAELETGIGGGGTSGNDGLVRVATVKISTGGTRRPTHKLVILPTAD